MCLGIPGRIVEILAAHDAADAASPGDALGLKGRVSFGGVVREVSLAGVPEAAVGDWVIVHAGFALNRLEEEEAEEVFEYLRQISEMAGEERRPGD